MDRDGRADVLLSLIRDGVHDLTLQILFGDGRGRFSRTIEHRVPANIVDMALADVNHDGRLDVIAVTFDVLVVMLGTAQGGLSEAMTYSSSGYRLALGDLNEDGHVDVVCEQSDCGVVRNG